MRGEGEGGCLGVCGVECVDEGEGGGEDVCGV